MIRWKKKIYNESSNTYALMTTIEGIEVAFLNRPDFDTGVWKIRFDKKDYDGDPKILRITEEAFRWGLGLERAGEVIDYLKFFAPWYLKSLNYDFDKIPQDNIIKSTDSNKLLKYEEEKIFLVKPEEIHEDGGRDIFWTSIHFATDSQKMSTILVCASFEYVSDFFRVQKVERAHLNLWLQTVINKWKILSDKVFDQDIHFDVYATSSEGYANGLDFLKTKI